MTATTRSCDRAADVRPSAERRQTQIGWLRGRHSFDTGVDPMGRDTHHGVLIVNNHDTIAPRAGFGTHPHQNMEIVTWVLRGAVVHQDSEGHSGVIYPDLAQRMTAGTGIWHSERNDPNPTNPDGAEELELIQMWVVPDERNIDPGYEQVELSRSDLRGRLAVLASGMERHRDVAALHIANRFAALHVGRLDPGETVRIPDAPFGHLYVARGIVDLEGAPMLETGDAARLTGAGERRIEAIEPSEVLFWEMHAAVGHGAP